MPWSNSDSRKFSKKTSTKVPVSDSGLVSKPDPDPKAPPKVIKTPLKFQSYKGS